MSDEPEDLDGRDAQGPDPQGRGLPSSLIPRWLALAVLIALLAAAAFSVVSLLTAEPPGPADGDPPAADAR